MQYADAKATGTEYSRCSTGTKRNHPMRVHCLAMLLCIVALSGIPDASAAGDPQRGREIATACSACHGLDGSSFSPAFPILGGQHQEYLVQAMLAYQAGTRADSIMGGAIRTLRRQQIEDVAAWFSIFPNAPVM